ncbi:YbaB/EbfC family nucleoid-associated protein [Nocardia sp. NPDC051750]|uniref:YbaB/EbfC family nucleoid-associated protein n=1 Tax=Nocardia sp. NPDC051750 TaxID=3364325 RepID=UPI003799DA7D
MPNEQAKSEFAELLEGAQAQVRNISRIQQERAELTAAAQARGKKVTVTVNADNKVIDVKFADDIGKLSYFEIARAVVEAAQKASADVARKTAELMTPIQEQQARMPKLIDMLGELSIDASGLRISESIEAPVDSPKARQRRRFSDGSLAAPEAAAEESGRTPRGSIADSSW